jgi:pimeloyl-ACP methyl ester carboxylesterase
MKLLKKVLKILGIMFVVFTVLLLFVPFAIPIEGETGLSENQDLVNDNGDFVTIPFAGTNGIDIYYEFTPSTSDSTQNFILIHGSMYNSQTWNLVTEDLSAYGNVYAYDQAPYGLSEKLLVDDFSEENPYTIDAAVLQLELFMGELGIESAILVGSSYGAVIAAELAVNNSVLVDSMIFVDPAILVSEAVPSWMMNAPQADHLGPMIAKMMATSDAFYSTIYYDENTLDETRMSLNKQMTEINNYNLAYWEYLKAWMISPSDVQNQLDQINVDVLVLSGEFDNIVPMEDSETIAGLLPNATFIMIEDSGHMPHEEQPDVFMDVVSSWLDNLLVE